MLCYVSTLMSLHKSFYLLDRIIHHQPVSGLKLILEEDARLVASPLLAHLSISEACSLNLLTLYMYRTKWLLVFQWRYIYAGIWGVTELVCLTLIKGFMQIFSNGN